MILKFGDEMSDVRTHANSSGLNQGSIPIVLKRSKPLVRAAKTAVAPCFKPHNIRYCSGLSICVPSYFLDQYVAGYSSEQRNVASEERSVPKFVYDFTE